MTSKIFAGFRALGFVTNHVPIVIRYNKEQRENYILTCVGKAYHTNNCSKLALVGVSDSHTEEISCIAASQIADFTASGCLIQGFKYGKVAYQYEGHTSPVHLLLPFGEHLISVDESSAVKVWHVKSQDVYMELQFENNTFKVSAILHPSTYLNKVVFGSQQGALQLWNIHTSKLLYTFPGWGAGVTVMEQAPAVDVIAIGLEDGRVMIHNIKYDETIVHFKQDWGPVTTLAFRTDGHPIMATGSTQGHIALWDLEERKLAAQMRDAHSGSVTGMKCLPSEPLMVTSSTDNSLKVWIFDAPDGSGRLLRERSGHSAPPTYIRYHGNDGKNIISAGLDSTLRCFHPGRYGFYTNFGRASYNKAKSKKMGLKKDTLCMPPITGFASESSRQSDWDSVISCYRGLHVTTTWSWNSVRGCMGKHRPKHPRFKNKDTICQCVSISSCGNFAVMGYTSGHVDRYNMQSGLHRATYGNKDGPAHEGAVRGVAIDGLNQLVISAGADCKVKFWKFKQGNLVDEVTMATQVAFIRLHRDSGMLAVALDDFSNAIIDIETRKIVRRFSGHQAALTDMAFSPDGRWLITAGMDATVRTWDLPTGTCIDCFVVDEAVTSLDMSPLGEYLVTSHVDNLGVYLWSNMTVYKHVTLRPLPADYQPNTIAMPTTSDKSQGVRDDDEDSQEDEYQFASPEQIADELVTLSLLPHSRWHNLLNIDVIKERNKPKEPPKVPKSAPFFLPTIAGLEPKFDIPKDDGNPKKKKDISLETLLPLSEFGKMLSGKEYSKAMEHLKQLGPSQIDVEIRSLSPEGGGNVTVMAEFLRMIDTVLQTCRDYELAQAYLGLFLKLHGDIITSHHELITVAKELQETQRSSWQHLQDSFNQSLCLVSYIKTAAL